MHNNYSHIYMYIYAFFTKCSFFLFLWVQTTTRNICPNHLQTKLCWFGLSYKGGTRDKISFPWIEWHGSGLVPDI